METITLPTDINVFYVTAKSFPEGIEEAHKALHALVPSSVNRKYFGISRPEDGSIIYRAAAEELRSGEAGKLNLETLILKKGKYVAITIHEYHKDVQSIGRSFEKLLEHPGLDPQGYCVEWYLNEKDVKCMIRLERD